jgi:hypothetical protein
MPSVSKKQHNFMAAIAKNPSFAKKVGIKPSVGEEFLKADKGKTFKQGGIMKDADLAQDKKMVKRAVSMHDKQLHGGKSTNLSKLAKGGVARTVTKEMEYDYKTGKKSFAGSTAKRDAHAEKEGKRVAKDLAYDKSKMKSGGCVKMARGGGIETKGKTKGTFIKMKGC